MNKLSFLEEIALLKRKKKKRGRRRTRRGRCHCVQRSMSHNSRFNSRAANIEKRNDKTPLEQENPSAYQYFDSLWMNSTENKHTLRGRIRPYWTLGWITGQ